MRILSASWRKKMWKIVPEASVMFQISLFLDAISYKGLDIIRDILGNI